MKELAERNGFTFVGMCRVCVHPYYELHKTLANGRKAVLKVRKDGRKFRLYIHGGVIWGVPQNFENIMKINFLLNESNN